LHGRQLEPAVTSQRHAESARNGRPRRSSAAVLEPQSNSCAAEQGGNMLGDRDAVVNLAVKNLDIAKKFYERTLGLKQVAVEGGELIVYRSGNTMLNVYRSQ